MNKEIIIDGIDISECEFANACDKKMKCVILQEDVCETKPYCEGYNCYYKQLQKLKQENEEMHERLRTIIYNATGGRLSYSTYTVEAVEQAFYDQLEILTEQNTKELEEENERLKEEIKSQKEYKTSKENSYQLLQKQWKDLFVQNRELKAENERLKSELHSKTEYIQEQRDVIEQYRKEINMYKKCQGKRASKREAELRKENERLKEETNIARENYGLEMEFQNMYREALEEIRESCNDYAKTEDYVNCGTFNEFLELVFDKINEVLDEQD